MTTASLDNEQCRTLVLEYLLHRCYRDTAKVFVDENRKLDACSGLIMKNSRTTKEPCNGDEMDTDQANAGDVYDNEPKWAYLEPRKALSLAIEQGNIPLAFDILCQHFPALMAEANFQEVEPDTPWKHSVQDMLFKMRCQQFVEIVRVASEVEAIQFAQTYLKPMHLRYHDKINEVASLIAYADPYQSNAKYLLEDDRRHDLAEQVNKVVLAHCSLRTDTALETLYRQEQVVQQERNLVLSSGEANDRDKMSM